MKSIPICLVQLRVASLNTEGFNQVVGAGKQGRIVDGSSEESEIPDRDLDRKEVRVRRVKLICVGMSMAVLETKVSEEE